MTPRGKAAFFGLGVMGLPMASRLLDAGFEVAGYDPDPARVSQFKAHGGRGTSDQPFVVDADVGAVITMLPSAQAVRAVLDGVLSVIGKPILFIDCSTIDVKSTEGMALAAGRCGVAFIDAPVSGGFELAAAGKLSFMVGGEAEAVSRARPIFDAMGAHVIHFGPAGSGQAVKACNNMVVGISMLALCEGFALIDRMGLDKAKVLELWMNAGVRSWLLENRCPVPGLLPNAPSSHGYKTGFASTLMVKDLELAQRASEDEGLPTPFGALALERYRAFVAEGNGDLDFSAIYRSYLSPE